MTIDLDIATDAEKGIYREINEQMKEEAEGKQDHWWRSLIQNS